MDQLGKIESDNSVISTFSKAASLQIDTTDFLGTWTAGLFPGVENNGGLFGELPALALGDQLFYRVSAPLIEDENGKLVLDKSNMQHLGEVDRPKENDYVFTNGMQNDLDQAIQKGAMQTGAVEFILAYNPEHGFFGDVLEGGWDMYLGGVAASGNARRLRGFFLEGIDDEISFNIAAHSQGGILTYRAMYGLDFSGDASIDTGTVLFSGAPIGSLDFYAVARKAGFKVSDKLYDTNVIFQSNRPEGQTSFFNVQMVDSVSEMPMLGGNGSFGESLLSLPYVILPLDKASPHSNYLCQRSSCATVGKQLNLEFLRANYPKPKIYQPAAYE